MALKDLRIFVSLCDNVTEGLLVLVACARHATHNMKGTRPLYCGARLSDNTQKIILPKTCTNMINMTFSLAVSFSSDCF